MLRRLATLALTFSLAASSFAGTADARAFAAAPGAPIPVRPDSEQIEPPAALPRRTPELAPATRAHLRKLLASRRAKNVAAFRAYAKRGVYPHNFINNGELNVWIDGDGHMCAAATMIFKSGAKKLVKKVAKDNNYIRLADVTDGPLLTWILTSGLTHDEVVAIQAPMVGGPRPQPEPPEDWRIVEDRRLRARYSEVLTMLDGATDASLDAAIDELAWRPDLVATLLTARR
jgi:hypothetical protein